MSDAVIIAAIGSLTTTIGLIITGYLNYRQNKKISGNVEEYHKEVNGKMGILLETTKELGKSEEKAEENERQKNA